jgi:hypothetical protein|tara:strand:- start:6 stop:191 length:186 start_codon:yes stop_codon:yes gene_type:complete
MAQQVNQISNGGIANISGLKVYMTVTVGDDEFLIPIVAEDEYGNAHQVLRRNINNVIEDDE